MTAHTSDVTPAIEASVPTGSKRLIVVSREVGTIRAMATRATAMTGTLIIRTEPHQKCSSSQPPVTGPRATAAPAVAAHTAIAAARSRGAVKTLTRMASVAGNISAAPTPIAARQPISSPGLSDHAARAENTANRTSPICIMPLRPNRSPMLPAAISRPAKTRT